MMHRSGKVGAGRQRQHMVRAVTEKTLIRKQSDRLIWAYYYTRIQGSVTAKGAEREKENSKRPDGDIRQT